jgi:transcriptional regulator with XRE-family HTH domain
MNKKEKIRAILGITQEKLAIELKITRSQLSMYELGKRDLPAVAKLKLAEMTAEVQKTKTIDTEISIEKHQIILKDFLFLNKRKNINIEKISNTLNNKVKKLKGKNLINTNSITKQSKVDLEKLKLEILKLSIKKEILKEEEIFLNNKLKNLENNNDSIM